MIVTQRRTMFVFVFVFLVCISTSRGESFSKTCHAVEGLVQTSACRLTECRVVGQTKVRLGGDDNAGLEAQGDLVLLDHVCDRGAVVSNLVSTQVEMLQRQGFAVQGSSHVEANSALVVLKKGSQWMELTALVLEGAPNYSVRSITPDRPRIEIASTKATSIPVVSRSDAEQRPVRPPQPAEPAAQTGSTPAKATGPSPALPAGVSASTAEARVDLELIVDEKGQLLKVLSTKGNPSLIPVALNAIKTWKFEPAIESGKPILSALSVRVEFQPRP